MESPSADYGIAISRLWNRHQLTGNVTDLPRSGRPRSTQRQDHLFVTNALRDGTQTAAQLQQQLFYDTEVLVATQTEKKQEEEKCTCRSAASSSSQHCAAIECQPSPGKEGMVSTPSEVDCHTVV